MTKKRQIKFTLIRTLVAISIALLVAALLRAAATLPKN